MHSADGVLTLTQQAAWTWRSMHLADGTVRHGRNTHTLSRTCAMKILKSEPAGESCPIVQGER